MAATIADSPMHSQSLMDASLLTLPTTSKKIVTWLCQKCEGTWKESVVKRCSYRYCPKCHAHPTRKAIVFPKGVPLNQTASNRPEQSMGKVKPFPEKVTNVECEICCIETRKMVQCPVCLYECCCTCLETYIFGGIGRASCMNVECHNPFTTVFLASVYGKKWVTEKYRPFLENAIVEHDYSLIPSTMNLVAMMKKQKEIEGEIKNLHREENNIDRKLSKSPSNNELYYLLRSIKEQEKLLVIQNGTLVEEIASYSNTTTKTKKVHYLQGCPSNNCRGLIDDTFKCTVCNVIICEICRLVHDGACKKEDAETAKELKSSTKPCPTCSVPVYKVDGCDQMWCTACNTAFSWMTLRVERGAIHNPHYFEWLSKQNEIPQDIEHQECGIWEPEMVLDKRLLKCVGAKKSRVFNQLRDVINSAEEHLEYCIQSETRVLAQMRAAYIMGKKSESAWKRSVVTRNDYIDCLRIRQQVTQTISAILRDRITRVRDALMHCDDVVDVLEEVMSEAEKVRLHFNQVIVDELCGCRDVVVFSQEWEWVSYAKAKRDEYIRVHLNGM